ncbi:MAG: lipoprotein [Hyphomicrobiaceae bacterium]|nr:lipoprotein [Hyphomicrobiaceae bacterium]
MAKWLLTSVMLAAVAASVGGCGIKGSLDAPAAAKAAGETRSAESAGTGPNSAAPPKQHEPFILDRLLR